MPTFEWTSRFERDLADLREADPDLESRFRDAVRQFVEDLSAGRPPRPGLRVKPIQGTSTPVRELTFAPNGRATWQFGTERVPGTPHIIWRRIGTHDVLARP